MVGDVETSGLGLQLSSTAPSLSAANRAPVANVQAVRETTEVHTMLEACEHQSASPPTESDTSDVLAEAELANERLDRYDATFIPASESKRRQQRGREAVTPRRAVCPNKPYEKCSPEMKTRRDEHVSTIESNWGISFERRMSASTIPKLSGSSVRSPRDWSSTFLQPLAHLSNLTSSDPQTAFKALEKAVRERRKSRTGGKTILPVDVEVACKACKKGKGALVPVRTGQYQSEAQASTSATMMRSPTMGRISPPSDPTPFAAPTSTPDVPSDNKPVIKTEPGVPDPVSVVEDIDQELEEVRRKQKKLQLEKKIMEAQDEEKRLLNRWVIISYIERTKD